MGKDILQFYYNQWEQMVPSNELTINSNWLVAVTAEYISPELRDWIDQESLHFHIRQTIACREEIDEGNISRVQLSPQIVFSDFSFQTEDEAFIELLNGIFSGALINFIHCVYSETHEDVLNLTQKMHVGIDSNLFNKILNDLLKIMKDDQREKEWVVAQKPWLDNLWIPSGHQIACVAGIFFGENNEHI